MTRKLSPEDAAEVARILAETPLEFDENAEEHADFPEPIDAASAAAADAILEREAKRP